MNDGFAKTVRMLSSSSSILRVRAAAALAYLPRCFRAIKVKILIVPIAAMVISGCAARVHPTGEQKIVVDTYDTNSAYLDGYFAGYYDACVGLAMEAKKRLPNVQQMSTPTLLTIRQSCRDSVYGWIRQYTGDNYNDETLDY